MFRFIRNIFNRLFYHFRLKRLVPQLKGVDSKTLFEKIRPGDIVLAAMNVPPSRLKNLKSEHRIRPYIIASKYKNSIYAYCGSSNYYDQFKYSFFLTSKKYKVWKNGNIRLDRCYYLPQDHLIEIMDHLKTRDIIKINSIIVRQKNPSLKPIRAKTPLVEGAIVSRGRDLYYIYSLSKDSSIFYKLEKSHNSVEIRFGQRTYYIDPDAPIRLQATSGYKLYDLMPLSIKKAIDARKNIA